MSRPAIHPGEILAEELAASGVTPTELTRLLKVPANRITRIIQGKRSISGDTALRRLGHWFGTSGQFWLNLQSAYDIRVAAQESKAFEFWGEGSQMIAKKTAVVAIPARSKILEVSWNV